MMLLDFDYEAKFDELARGLEIAHLITLARKVEVGGAPFPADDKAVALFELALGVGSPLLGGDGRLGPPFSVARHWQGIGVIWARKTANRGFGSTNPNASGALNTKAVAAKTVPRPLKTVEVSDAAYASL
jgi:hypothetical protein